MISFSIDKQRDKVNAEWMSRPVDSIRKSNINQPLASVLISMGQSPPFAYRLKRKLLSGPIIGGAYATSSEELKSRKFFSGLQRLGLDYCVYQPHLDKPILAAVGFDDPSDEVYAFYFNLIEKRSRKMTEDEESITREARKVYKRLVSEREKWVGIREI